MVWEIHARTAGRHDAHAIRVRARWTGLGSVDDVSLDCGHGVHELGVGTTYRRQMNAFSRPIGGVFRWDGDVQRPEIVVTWTDGGEPCEERIPLTAPGHHALPQRLRHAIHHSR
jgi:hypothetical protein